MDPSRPEPDFLFEVSWEVCNKVGGIHTVIATKALSLVRRLGDKFIMIGPDVWKGPGTTPGFEEDPEQFRTWKPHIEAKGIRVKTGRWTIAGNPSVVLIDYTTLIAEKDRILTDLWLNYKVDSLTGRWDYIEPALFGYAAAIVIDSFYDHYITFTDRVIAQFHEWMTGAGVLYLKGHMPQIGTVFTTHATVVGRAIAGNGLPLYTALEKYDAGEEARRFDVLAKHSLEKQSALYADTFTTVSRITAKECDRFLGKSPDVITPNGFEESFVPDNFLLKDRRIRSRRTLLSVASRLFDRQFKPDSLLVLKSGRYEMRNKGIDVFIDALGILDKDTEDLEKEVIAFIFVPAHHLGPLEFFLNGKTDNSGNIECCLTHYLQGRETDPILTAIKNNALNLKKSARVHAVFSPVYLDGNDGVYNVPYYELLPAFDLSVFPSYYEPWGYTPLESISFGVPTVTTSNAGFGSETGTEQKAITVLNRTDSNSAETAGNIASIIATFSALTSSEISGQRDLAMRISKKSAWKNLLSFYSEAYAAALVKSSLRHREYHHESAVESWQTHAPAQTPPQKPVWRKIFVEPELPEKLGFLSALAHNLWWTWNAEAIELFDRVFAVKGGEPNVPAIAVNPVELLHSLSAAQVEALSGDEEFIQKMNKVKTLLSSYLSRPCEQPVPKTGYLSMEYGLHSSMKLYSGGLGILAGDFLKQASDSGLNVVAAGLLYRNGYFQQAIAADGEQTENDDRQRFTAISIVPVRDADGDWIKITIPFPGRTLYAKAWKALVGRVALYLLDTDIDENTAADRRITSRLYASDQQTRFQQELLLGVGGVRLFTLLGIRPDLYHCNEGHAALAVIERIALLMVEEKVSFDEALEVVRASTLFTTHTVVEAAYDIFTEDLLRPYLSHYSQLFNVDWARLMALGAPMDGNKKLFSVSDFAARCASGINAVSRVHRDASRKLLRRLWPGLSHDEIPIGYVTNGIHVPTWMCNELQKSLLTREDGSRRSLTEAANDVKRIPDEDIWKIHQRQKGDLLRAICTRHIADKSDPAPTILTPDTMLVGFARRFVPYKRPALVLNDFARLEQIVSATRRPVAFIFAGKAHPNDQQGQQLVKAIVAASKQPRFSNRIIFLPDYDMELARLMVSGVDLWLNTPVKGEEASGTSGMKASVNGVPNLSIPDGWWAEGASDEAGWTITPDSGHEETKRDIAEAASLYRMLESEIIPLYYDRDATGVPHGWIRKMKAAISQMVFSYSAERMIAGYNDQYYRKLAARTQALSANGFEKAALLVRWKHGIEAAWDKIRLVRSDLHDSANNALAVGSRLESSITVDIGDISVNDLAAELVMIRKRSVSDEPEEIVSKEKLVATPTGQPGIVTYRCASLASRSGVFEYAFRLYPSNALLDGYCESELVKWF